MFLNSKIKSALRTSADLLTAAQVVLRRYTALDCSADRMALKEEKFFICLHSCGNGHSCTSAVSQQKNVFMKLRSVRPSPAPRRSSAR